MDFQKLNERLQAGRHGITEDEFGRPPVVTVVSFDGVKGGSEEYTCKDRKGKKISCWYPENPNPNMSRYVKGDKVKIEPSDGNRIIQRA